MKNEILKDCAALRNQIRRMKDPKKREEALRRYAELINMLASS